MAAKSLTTRVDVIEPMVYEHDTMVSAHRERIIKIELWKNGNGGIGAEKRLQEIEESMVTAGQCTDFKKQIFESIETIKNRPRNTWLKVKDVVLLALAIGGFLSRFIR